MCHRTARARRAMARNNNIPNPENPNFESKVKKITCGRGGRFRNGKGMNSGLAVRKNVRIGQTGATSARSQHAARETSASARPHETGSRPLGNNKNSATQCCQLWRRDIRFPRYVSANCKRVGFFFGIFFRKSICFSINGSMCVLNRWLFWVTVLPTVM